MNIKTYQDYLIDFDALKVGDTLWSCSLGFCHIFAIHKHTSFPILVKNNKGFTCSYTKTGDFDEGSSVTLFKEKPDFFKEKKEVKVWCWYVQLSKGVLGETTNNRYTESEIKSLFPNHLFYEKIDCTEITEVVYE